MSRKRLFEIIDDGLDDLLSQAVVGYENEEVVLGDGLDNILLQSLDMFEEQKKLEDDAIDITDMFEEKGGPSLVMAWRFPTAKGNPARIYCFFFVRVSFLYLEVMFLF